MCSKSIPSCFEQRTPTGNRAIYAPGVPALRTSVSSPVPYKPKDLRRWLLLCSRTGTHRAGKGVKRTSQHLFQIAAESVEPLLIHAGMDTHAIDHSDKVFGGYQAGAAGGKGVIPRALNFDEPPGRRCRPRCSQRCGYQPAWLRSTRRCPCREYHGYGRSAVRGLGAFPK